MTGSGISKDQAAALDAAQAAELLALAERVRGRLQRSAADILAIGADLIHAKELVGYGKFGSWLDTEFSLSKRSAEQFMAAFRRFGAGGEAVAHLPAGAVLELSAPSVSDDLVKRVLAGELPASVSAIRQEKSGMKADDRAYAVAGTFMDHLERFNGTSEDYAAGIAAHVLRRWKTPENRAWFAECMFVVSQMLDANTEAKVSTFERPSTTVRNLLEQDIPD